MSFMSRINSSSFHTGPLSDEQILAAAPSVFANAAHSSRSERFVPIPTFELVGRMRDQGFLPYSAKQANTSDATRRGFNKHMIRFRHESSALQGRKVGDTHPEVILINANDGGSSYRLLSGLFRLACLNGMIIADGHVESVRVPHMGRDVVEKVIEGSYKVLGESRRALDAADAWAGIELTRPERLAFAEAAHTARFADADGTVSTPIAPAQLLTVRRREDDSGSLWATFNAVQENAIRGGLTGTERNPETRRSRRVTSRAVTGIDGDVRLNQALWTLGQRMAEIKSAA